MFCAPETAVHALCLAKSVQQTLGMELAAGRQCLGPLSTRLAMSREVGMR